MWLPEGNNLVDNVGSTFLIAAWHELFHAFTPDSNQPRLHNVASLINELGDVSLRCCSDERFNSHLERVQQELNEAVENEDDVLARLPEYRSRSEALVKANSPKAINTECELLEELRDDYERNVIELATEAVSGLPRSKKKAHKGIRRIATLALQGGKEDNDVWDVFNPDQTRSPNELFDDLVELSIAGSRTFNCTLAVFGKRSEIQSTLRMIGFAPVSKDKLPEDYLSKVSGSNGGPMFVQFAATANSIRHAVSESRKKLGTAAGFVSLYRHSHAMHPHPITLVESSGTQVLFSQSDQAFRRLHPRARADTDIRAAMDLVKNRNLDNRILGAVELLSLESSESDSRVRLTNLWSSVETLSGAHEGRTTLERVTSMLVPLVITRHIGRAVRNLSIELQRFGAAIGKFDYGKGFSRSHAKYVSPIDMLLTLASPPHTEPICDLLKFSEHPLLRFHIFRAWETLHDPKSLHGRLLRSKKSVEWQIQRIYRARNLLVHQGEETPFLDPLLDNLQNYLSMATQRLIHELKKHPSWRLRHVIEHWNGRMQHTLRSLERCPNVLTVNDVIDGGPNDKIWPK